MDTNLSIELNEFFYMYFYIQVTTTQIKVYISSTPEGFLCLLSLSIILAPEYKHFSDFYLYGLILPVLEFYLNIFLVFDFFH